MVTKRLQNGYSFFLCIFNKNDCPKLFDILQNGNYNCLELEKSPIINVAAVLSARGVIVHGQW